MKKLLLLVGGFCLLSAFVYGQGVINRMQETRNGQIYLIFRSEKADSTITASSNQLRSIFNYNQQSGFKLIADWRNFQSPHQQLDSFLNQIEPPSIEFKAPLRTEWFKPNQGHRQFMMESTIDCYLYNQTVQMEADLYEVSRSNQVRAQLRLRRDFDLNEWGLKELLPGFSSTFYIELYQPLMEPDRFHYNNM